MRSKLLIIALGSALAACNTPDLPDKALSTTKVPVVTSADYVFDAAAPGGMLGAGEADRLNGWLAGLGLSYGDVVYVDGPFTEAARGQVASVVGQYGILVSDGAPITAGVVPPGSVRVIVSRRRATVPGCPDWSIASEPNYDNRNVSNFGCGVNSNLAMQVANPEDLLHGREGSSAVDTRVVSKAYTFYRTTPPSGTKGLQSFDTKKDK